MRTIDKPTQHYIPYLYPNQLDIGTMFYSEKLKKNLTIIAIFRKQGRSTHAVELESEDLKRYYVKIEDWKSAIIEKKIRLQR